MPRGEHNRKLSVEQLDEINRRYVTQLSDGTWVGTTTLGREFGVAPGVIRRHLRLRGVTLRTAREAHSGGKQCKPVRNLPRGEAPTCACACGGSTDWNQRKNRWNRYVVGHYRRDAPYKDVAWLRTEYVTKGRAVADLAAECSVGESTVAHFMDLLGIPRRNGSDAHIGRQTGPDNPAWKGGVADWDYSSDWKVVARKIRDRDRWTCQDCGEQRQRWGVHLHVHHIDENKLNNADDNLISLCAKCHRDRHRRKGGTASG